MSKDSLENAAGQVLEIELKGKKYKISELNIGDYVAFKSYIKSNRINEFLSYADSLPATEKREGLMQLTKEVISEADLMEHSSTPEGILFMFWRLLRKTDKNITIEQAEELMNDIKEDDVTNLMAVANNLQTEDTDNPLAMTEANT